MPSLNRLSPSPTVLDLFCGCGGFSLGFERAGFRVVAALDIDPYAITTYRMNRPDVPPQCVLEADLTTLSPRALASKIGIERVDVILGGPPCQGFSTVRQVDGSNSGCRLIHDPRRELFRDYFRYIRFFRPTFFLMENVPGLRVMNKGQWWTQIRSEARLLGYRLCPTEFAASDFGVPQRRHRLLIVGTREDASVVFCRDCLKPTHNGREVTLGEAIGDLPPLKANDGVDPAEYNLALRQRHVARYGEQYLKGVLEIDKAAQLTHHVARPHSDRDLRDFARLKEGENSRQAMCRGVEFEFPYKKHIFKDRYTKHHRGRPCSTILAHMAKDGLMFIHPTQPRSLTVREAARIQSFPDWFQFPHQRTHAYRLIGNAVPPLVGLSVGKALISLVERGSQPIARAIPTTGPPRSAGQAVAELLPVIEAARAGRLKSTRHDEFLRAWNACFFLLPGLHPDEATDHGDEVGDNALPRKRFAALASELTPFYVRSGWPVALAPLAQEAWRRYHANELQESDIYCCESQQAGLRALLNTGNRRRPNHRKTQVS